MVRPAIKWAYGVTTVPERRLTLLPKTLESLRDAGFDKPYLFVDGVSAPTDYVHLGLEVTCRYPALRIHGNWFLSLHELWIRFTDRDRYAIFQDDFVTYKNLRHYLDSCVYPGDGYLNLYTFPANQDLCPKGANGEQMEGWYRANQLGKGAVALVFNQQATIKLLASQHMVERPMSPHRGTRSVDGGVVTGLRAAGIYEYVHNPSLVQHTGDDSTKKAWMDDPVQHQAQYPQPKSPSFRGEHYDAMGIKNCLVIP